jgi:hypothetical protein
MASVELKVPVTDGHNKIVAWKEAAKYKTGEIAILTQESEIARRTRFIFGRQAGPLWAVEIPGSSLGSQEEVDANRTEKRVILVDVATDGADIYFAKPGVTEEEVTRKHGDKISQVIYDATRIQHVSRVPIGAYATITSVNGKVQTAAFTVL